MKKIKLMAALTALLIGGFCAGNAAAQGKYGWNGEWTVTSRYTPATLTIKPVSATKFRFKVGAMSGANMGDISGIAVIKGNKAYFDDRQGAKKDANIYGCRLTFTNKGTQITLVQNEKCSSYAGLNVSFEGDYLKGKQRKFTENFVERGVFPNSGIERKFKLLIKSDYENFISAYHQVYPEDDLDNLGATVYSGCIEGICTWWTAIIMFDKKGNFWAAVLRAENEQPPVVRYYTNAPDWTEKLPKTIEKWVDNLQSSNENLKIVYKNKN